MQVDGQAVLITGATRGIGRALAEKLAARGARLLLVGRDAAALEVVRDGLAGEAKTHVCDLSRPDEVDKLVRRVREEHGGLSVLVNNAAAQRQMDFIDGDRGELTAYSRAEIALNLTAPITLIAGLLPLLARQGEAVIVNVSSALALAPKQAAPVYCAGKAGLRSFGRALRYQCADAAPHVRVCEVIMPLVDTDMTRGRGSGKISAATAAAAILSAIESGRDEYWVGKSRLLPLLGRLSPKTVERILR
ncbi:SDR family oxidoreductase [Nitratireductor thuwali]|uniref:Fatty acyl-CoA reductase n=1 Tax=Nitratireductor thuwali TaxID=2267699 RepID=A0ABY5MJH6_9HYPH|nr:Fatty acyl-CoA reductase [Nitratireductor thuwali]